MLKGSRLVFGSLRRGSRGLVGRGIDVVGWRGSVLKFPMDRHFGGELV